MDFHQLQYFVAIAESGSITAAAKKLFLSQPPLSMQMKRLEKELGCVLFLRGAREVQLTEAGKLLYTRAKSMLELRRITEEELAVCSEQTSGTIRLGVISSVGCSLLPQWLKWFHAQYPQIRFSLYESDTYQILEKLHQDRVELALVRSPFSAEGIQKVPLQTESLIAVGHHSFFSEADTISLQELAERPLIIYRRWEHILNQTFRTLELPVSYFCVNEDARTTVYWADAGLGVGIIPESACS
ncbi:MAG: LysR family transcriptional regulator, partial [Ruminococcus sp.]|nr:LysR family transcriptional regulator [Ruminococcus sp.]